jgi:lipopolysaccharide/colanic/teichoic acid biosynthesis glycosyltransferase
MEPLPIAALPTSEPAGRRMQGRRVRAAVAQGSGGYYFKRFVDLVFAALLALLLLPLLLLIAVLIKLDSPGAVIFAQERVGARRRSRDGQTEWEVVTFPCYKFRSMVRDASQSMHEAHIRAFVEDRLDTTRTVKLTADPRVTRIGRLLRRTSLDELPQLANVLRGEMSLVGPRPVPVYEAAAYVEWHYERLAALPGITGWWQVKGRGLVSFTEMVRMDIAYVRNQSLWLDIKILLATIPAVLSRRGAE